MRQKISLCRTPDSVHAQRTSRVVSHLACKRLDAFLQLDPLRSKVSTEAFLLLEGGMRLLELAVQSRQLFLLRLVRACDRMVGTWEAKAKGKT